MSEKLQPAPVAIYSDHYYAENIRKQIAELNRLVVEAKTAGLKIKLNLNTLGLPAWVGYHDALEISREY